MRSKILAISLALMMGLSLLAAVPGAQAASYGWTVEGSLPNDMTSFVSAELPDGRIFVACGYDSENTERLNSTWVLDPDGWSWTALSDAPFALESPTGAYLDGKVFVFGGFTTSGYQDTVLIYNVSTDVWSSSQNLPYKGTFMRCMAIDDENILLVGGNPDDAPATNETYIFNIDTEEFTAVASLPEARGGGGLARIGGLVYYFGGWGDSFVVHDEIFAYDIAGDSWELVGHLPVPRTSMSAVAASNGLVYLLGGGSGITWYDSGNVDEVLAWDPVSGLFSTFPPMPEPLRYVGALQIDSRIVYFGGHDKSNGNPNIYSLETLRIAADLSSGTVNQGESVWLHVWTEAEMVMEDSLHSYAYLTKDNVTYGSYYIDSAGGDDVMLEISISEDLPAGEYELEFQYLTIDYWSLDWKMAPLSLTVTAAPSTNDRMDDLEQQNQDLQDRIDALQEELDAANADLKEAVDAKLDASLGYIILIAVLACLVMSAVALVVMLRRK